MNVFDKFLEFCDGTEPLWVGMLLFTMTTVIIVVITFIVVLSLATTYPFHVVGVLFAAYILMWLYAINKVS